MKADLEKIFIFIGSEYYNYLINSLKIKIRLMADVSNDLFFIIINGNNEKVLE